MHNYKVILLFKKKMSTILEENKIDADKKKYCAFRWSSIKPTNLEGAREETDDIDASHLPCTMQGSKTNVG